MPNDQTVVTFYYRQGCHLCEDMWHHLQQFREEFSLQIELVDIDSDPVLGEKYGRMIPVLCGGDSVLCNYYLDPVALRAFAESDKCVGG